MLKKLNKQLSHLYLNYPIPTIFISLLLTMIISSGTIYVKQDDDMVNLLPDEIGSRQTFDEIQEEYGLTEYMYVAVGNKDKNILNKNDLDVISNLSNQFQALTIVDDVISITNLDKISLDPADSSIVIDDLFEFPILNNLEIEEAIKYLNNNQVIKKRVLSKNNDYANIIIIPENIEGVYVELSEEIHNITEKYKEDYELSFGGQAYVTGAVPGMVQKEVKILLLFGLLLMAAILLVNLRNIKAVLLILFVIFSSLASMFGFMGWIYHFTGSKDFYFTLMNTSMPIVLLTIANSDGVHVLSRFFKEFRKSKKLKIAIKEAMHNLFLPIFLTSITTSAAFLMLIFSPISAMIGYGITLAFGIMWAWFLSNTTLPSLILLLKWDPESKAISQPGYIERLMKLFGHLVTKNPKKVLSLGVGLTGFAIIGLFLITVEVQYNKMFRKGNIIRDSAEFLDENLMGNVNVLLRVTSDLGPESLKNPENLKDIEKIQTYLDSINYVTSTISIIDVVKQLHKTIMDEDKEYYTIPDSIQQINNLFFLYEMNEESDLSSLINYDADQGIITGLMKTFSTVEVPGLVEDINKFIDENIYSSNKNLKFELTGMMIFIVDFIWLVIKSSTISIILSLLAIFSISALFFKSWRYGIMSTIPLISAIILNFGLMGWFGIELTHLTAILSSIILGVGVDFTIHYITEYQRIKREEGTLKISEETIDNVGYPIILDAWSNMAFGALLLSTIIPLAQIGGLMIFAMLSTSIGALTLLASALELFKLKMR